MCDCVIVGGQVTLCEQHERLTQTAVRAFQLGLLESQMHTAIDGVQMMALATGRIVQIDAADVPRLLVSAACRSLERLIETYQARRASLSLTDQGKFLAEIKRTSDDLRAVLDEGLDTARGIIASLDVTPPSVD